MGMTIRQLPATEPRVETGAVQFGDDWPGTFIRGDNAMNYAVHLEAVLKASQDAPAISRAVVLSLLDDLIESNISPPPRKIK